MGLDAGRELLARGLIDGRCQMRLHQAGGALGQQGFEGDAIDDVQRVEHIALGLGHLLAFAVAHQAMHIHFAERHIAHELDAEHHHAGDPEKDDVKAGDQHITGVIAA